MLFRNTRRAKIAKQCMLALATPRIRDQMRKFLFRIQMILIIRKNKADLVHIIPVQILAIQINKTIHEMGSRFFSRHFICPFARTILEHDRRTLFFHIVVGVHSRIRLQIKSKMTIIAPVYNVLDIFF